MKVRVFLAAIVLGLAPCPAAAESAREILVAAAFTSSDKASALASVARAIKSADTVLAHNPKDQEARLQRALAISYRGKLTRSRSDLIASRRDFEAAVAADPRNPEAQMALAGWHLGAVIELGSLMARTVLGARKETGLQALNRALALGGNRASFLALAALHQIQLNPKDVAGTRKLAEEAAQSKAAMPIDRLMQRQARTLLTSLRSGNGKAAAKTAKRLLPFGLID